MTFGPVKSDWKRQLDASVFALRSDVLETLRQRIYELQEQQICNLKEEYGIRWDQMTGTASGSGYEICQEILTTLNNIQAKDYWEFMSPCIVEEEHANLAPTIFPKISPNPSSLNSSLLNEFAEELKRNARRSNERGTTE